MYLVNWIGTTTAVSGLSGIVAKAEALASLESPGDSSSATTDFGATSVEILDCGPSEMDVDVFGASLA
jgi:hypothetical protein